MAEQGNLEDTITIEETEEKPVQPEQEQPETTEEVQPTTLVGMVALENVIKAGGTVLGAVAKSWGATEEEYAELIFSDEEAKAIVEAFKDELEKIPMPVLKVLILVPIFAKRGVILYKIKQRSAQKKPEVKVEEVRGSEQK